MSRVVLEAGTVLSCPKCHVRVAELLKSIHARESIKAQYLRGIREPIRAWDTPTCPLCGSRWLSQGSVHTEAGWVSLL